MDRDEVVKLMVDEIRNAVRRGDDSAAVAVWNIAYRLGKDFVQELEDELYHREGGPA